MIFLGQKAAMYPIRIHRSPMKALVCLGCSYSWSLRSLKMELTAPKLCKTVNFCGVRTTPRGFSSLKKEQR